jgi:hypothetical protein
VREKGTLLLLIDALGDKVCARGRCMKDSGHCREMVGDAINTGARAWQAVHGVR